MTEAACSGSNVPDWVSVIVAARAPTTSGAAADVPVKLVYSSPGHAEMISKPGAATSMASPEFEKSVLPGCIDGADRDDAHTRQDSLESKALVSGSHDEDLPLGRIGNRVLDEAVP